MRILMATRYVDRSEAYLIEHLRQAGLGVEVVCDPGTPNLDRLRNANVPLTLLGFKSRMDPRAIITLRRVLREGRYDIVHAADSRALANSIWAGYGCKTKFIGYRGTLGNLSYWDPGCWMAHLHPRISRIVCVSEAVRRSLISLGMPERKLSTIHKGHDPEWYREWAKPDLSSLGIPSGAFVVGCAANTRYHKGVHVLVRAIHVLNDPRVHLLFAGEVRDELVRRAAVEGPAADRIHLIGFRKDAAQLTGSTHVFVMPSLAREGFPRAVLEAMSQEIPAVVTAVGGMPELVTDGVEGRVVPPDNAEALAEALRGYLENEDERRAAGKRAYARVAGQFHVSRTLERLKGLYEEVAGE